MVRLVESITLWPRLSRSPTRIIVVDDGSIDAIGREARGSGATVIRLDQDPGYIGAIKEGFTR